MLAALALWLTPYAFAAVDSDQAPKDISTMTAEELEAAGDECRLNKNYSEAARYFQEALRRDKKNARIYNKLGIAHMSAGDEYAAKYSFERAIRLNPNYANAFNNLGVVYFRQQIQDAAAKYFRKAVELAETRAAFHVNLGVTLFNQNSVALAMKEYARALELDPNVLDQSSNVGITVQIANPENRARFYFELARIQAARGEFEDCLKRLNTAKEYGYHKLTDVYRDELFSLLWDDTRLREIVAPPAAK